jgi:hypothetical protein
VLKFFDNQTIGTAMCCSRTHDLSVNMLNYG